MIAPPPAPKRDNQRNSDQGVRPDDRGQDQPTDKKRAQQGTGSDAQRDDARRRPPSPGQPAGGE
jgi:hypothetical protein